MCIHICCKINSCEKVEVCVAKLKIDGAQNCSRMCMCIEFVIQVLKQKNAHVSFPVGMVYLIVSHIQAARLLSTSQGIVVTERRFPLFLMFREYCFGEENSLSLYGKLGEFCEKLGEFASTI